MRAIHFNVTPRYSSGSPAQVDEDTARRVADDERRDYACALDGSYGVTEQKHAQDAGLAGIVEEREERADCWLVTDLLTGDRFVRMFPSIDEKRRITRGWKLRTKYHLPVEGLDKSTASR